MQPKGTESVGHVWVRVASRWWFCLALAPLLLAAAPSYQLHFEPVLAGIGIDQGLPGDQILSFGKDSSGSMWVGTANGLARLGGREPEVFHVAEGLPRATIYNISEVDGAVLVGTGAGVGRFDEVSRRFVAEGPLVGRVESFAVGGDETLWVLARNPPSLACRQGGTWHVASLPAVVVSPIKLAVAGGDLWFVDPRSGLWRGRIGEGCAVVWDHLAREPSYDLLALEGQRVAVRTARELWIFGAAGEVLERQLVPGGIGLLLRELVARPDGSLLVASDVGIFEWSPGRLVPLTLPRTVDPEGLLTLELDRHGDLWLGTFDRGAQVVQLASGIEVIEGAIAVSDLVDTEWHGSFAVGRGEIYTLDQPSTADRLVARPLAGGDGSRWMGQPCDVEGAVILSTTVGVQRIVGDPPAMAVDPRFEVLGDQLVTRVSCEASGRIWASGHNGLAVLDPGATQARLVGRRGGVGRYVYHVAEEHQVWAVEKGAEVWSLDRATEQVTNHPSPCPSRIVRWIVRAPGGGALLGCDDGGWATLGRPGGDLVGEAKGPLGGLAVLSVLPLEEPGRSLAVVGDRLVELQLDPPRIDVVVADRSELAGIELPFASTRRLRDGRLLVSSLRRVARLALARVEQPIGIVGQRLVATNATRRADGALELGPRPNRLALEVELADPLAASRIRYRWRFVGESWSEWQARGTVVATNVPPGVHQLEIEALDRRGLVTPPLPIAVEVRANWYELVVVRLLFAGLFVLAMVGFVRWRTARVEAERRRLERAVADRTLELAEANVRLEEASLTDPLTGLRNRRFLEPLADTLEPTTARGGERLLVVVADLDHFKQVNDRFGHATGDEVLVETARVLERSARASAVVARWGGEEFVVLERLAVGDDPAALVERLRLALATAPSQVQATASFGWCTTPVAGAGPIGWRVALELADHALYAAKADGRNCCRGVVGDAQVWSALEKAERRRWIERLGDDPRGAFAAGLFEVVGASAPP